MFVALSFLYFISPDSISQVYIKSDALSTSEGRIFNNSFQGYTKVYSQHTLISKDVSFTIKRNIGDIKASNPVMFISNSSSLQKSVKENVTATNYGGKIHSHSNGSVTQGLLGSLEDYKIFRRLKSTQVDCVRIIRQDRDYIEESRKLKYSSNLTNLLQNISGNCREFIQKRNYIMSSLTLEEKEFPIAYSLLVYKHEEQVERLLRAIYRPQNVYCIHIDDKANPKFTHIIRNLSSCFDNVFITKRSVKVYWGYFSVLEPELICMEELLKYKKWKYFINLTGQEFPLRTNSELVKILKIYNGANDVEGTLKRADSGRWNVKKKPPHGITPVKGSIHITVNRQFVEYVIYNQTAKDFLEWTRHVSVPDEVYFSSLNHNPHLKIPGSYTEVSEKDLEIKPFLTRFKSWFPDVPCQGMFIRTICVFGVGDLPYLTKKPHLFINKFFLNLQPIALDCMEEFHYNRTRDEFYNKFTFNTTFYEKLEFIKHTFRNVYT
ncbi:hypothetical protein KUTeg_002779 [Tegillarca granosa]|uniref:Beta-1,3-galactosyl-O-glycosyl-glycoprotein beta-1,6-N-acetylglucosaminyltransferase n=1 Tax=Tegillarca granosa TaxID=220873 RepID=A0ABQ9FQY8_TEGGR|nr:hypothetical protein KUTeg_002779 [Tegillarca granosa]